MSELYHEAQDKADLLLVWHVCCEQDQIAQLFFLIIEIRLKMRLNDRALVTLFGLSSRILSTHTWFCRDQSEVACQQWKCGILCVSWMRLASMRWAITRRWEQCLWVTYQQACTSMFWCPVSDILRSTWSDLYFRVFVLFELKTSFRYADIRVWGQCPLTVEVCVYKLHPAVHMEQDHIDNMDCIRDV